MIKEVIRRVVDGGDLTMEEAGEVMTLIMSGRSSDAQTASLLTALRMRGETIEEVTAFAQAMRRFCHQIHPNRPSLVDTCGTGGDVIKTFNISTLAAVVVAGAGIPVAKHGNRSVTSLCGSADLLEALGYNLDAEPERVEKSIDRIGIGFMYAPRFHPAMKYALGPRKEIGIRTIFNILGPLTNPANAKYQLLGVYHASLTEPIAHVLNNLGVEGALVVHGLDGLDEISILGKTKLTLLKDQEVSTKIVSPRDLGVKKTEASALRGSTPPESASEALRLLKGDAGKNRPRLDAVVVNAAAAIHVGGGSGGIRDGMDVAKESIESGAAYKALKALIHFSGGDTSLFKEDE